jgi:hypothetical protein
MFPRGQRHVSPARLGMKTIVFVMLAYLFGWLVGRYGGKTWKN